MHLDENIALKTGFEEYISDALEVVRTKFVDDASKVDEVKSHPIEFAYQQFGETEKIIGYKNLRITLIYSDLTMFSYLKVEHDGTLSNAEIKPDDIRASVLKLYPIEQQDCLVQDWPTFEQACQSQSTFKPFGECVSSFAVGNRKFKLYKVDAYSPEFDTYFSRVQTITMYFVEGSTYINTEDPRFMHYFLYEECDQFTTNQLKLAGYMSLYRYYAYPDLERARFAHVLVLPPYRNIGLGPKFLGSIFADIRQSKTIVDTTAEEPADAFVFMRDYCDVLTCQPLPEFSVESIKKGFNKEAMEKVRKEMKTCKMQCRRIFEILYLHYVQTVCPEEKHKFESLVKKRLAIPFRQSKRDSRRFTQALNDEERAVVTSHGGNNDQAIQNNYLITLDNYNTVLDRLIKYESSFH